jgi:hypothetical protein
MKKMRREKGGAALDRKTASLAEWAILQTGD